MKLFKSLKPTKTMTVTQWAEKYRILNQKSSAYFGPYSTELTPYVREIMDAMTINYRNQNGEFVNTIVVMKPAQVGLSEVLNNCVGYYIDNSPCPILYVLPTVEMAKRTSTDSIDPLIEDTPQLFQKIGKKRSSGSENAILKKGFTGGSLRFIGSNSSAGLRSAAVRILILDEVSSYPKATSEGDPVELAIKRTQTFGEQRKIIAISTPTIEGECKIEQFFQKTDKRFYYVPCPHCLTYQKLEFKNLKWDKDNYESIFYSCTHCESKILDSLHKKEMLKRGKWIPTHPEINVMGYHFSGLYSPWVPWSQIAKEFEESKGMEEKERVFYNTVLGETYRIRGESIDVKNIMKRRETYQRNKIPKPDVILTCGVDVQQDRIELEIVAWGRNKESWSIDYRVLVGNTNSSEVWHDLTEVLHEEFPMTNTNHLLKIQCVCIDSSDNTVFIYDFCRRNSSLNIYAIKGRSSLMTIFSSPKLIDYDFKGKFFKRGVKFCSLGVNILKRELYGFLKNDKNEDGTFPYGYCHFPTEYTEDYFNMLTSEELVFKTNSKKENLFEWIKVRERNEALDCRNYARAAAAILGYDRMKNEHFDELKLHYEEM